MGLPPSSSGAFHFSDTELLSNFPISKLRGSLLASATVGWTMDIGTGFKQVFLYTWIVSQSYDICGVLMFMEKLCGIKTRNK